MEIKKQRQKLFLLYHKNRRSLKDDDSEDMGKIQRTKT